VLTADGKEIDEQVNPRYSGASAMTTNNFQMNSSITGD
jgi:hypothetical protein